MDGDGKLDKKEVEELLYVMRWRFGLTDPAANRPGVDRLVENLLTRMDTNKDGKISKAEAQGLVAQNFDRLDTNKDGFLDKAELRRFAERQLANRPAGASQPLGPATQRPDFDAVDRDADGRLTREELRGTRWSDHFDEIDTNKDGKIDRKEFEAFVKKEAAKQGRAVGGP